MAYCLRCRNEMSRQLRSKCLQGGFCDRLLSNHTYNVGIAMLALEFQWGVPSLVAPLVCGAVGVAVVATRSHYTVDVVLALWVFAAVRAYTVASCDGSRCPSLTRDSLSAHSHR